MINLTVDIGNSSVKIAVFNDTDLIFTECQSTLSNDYLNHIKDSYQVKNLIISSVKQEIDIDENELKQRFNYIRFNHSTLIPIQNKYKSKDTLGLDRLAAVVAANHIYPRDSVMVIDAGTCITYDVVNNVGNYYGGSISPGIDMRFAAMHHFTSKLPLVAFDSTFTKAYGESSNEAIVSGAINGVAYEAEGFINAQLALQPNTKIILCGGNASFFDSRFKNSIFAHLVLHEPNLVLIGLNTIVNYQYVHK
jgi:type III pantothenate kinase